jgi:tetratricopeptide (TPR) repeat protein
MIRAYVGLAILLMTGADDHKPSAADVSGLGDTAWKSGDFQAAAEWYEQAVEFAPESPEPSYNLALTYYRMKLFGQALRYLDKAQVLAHGSLLGRCLLLRADIEYRNALAETAVRQVEGLERALQLYRIALAASSEAENVAIARYDIEVVKFRLPVARSQAPKVESDLGGGQQDVADDDATGPASATSKGHQRPGPEDRDW